MNDHHSRSSKPHQEKPRQEAAALCQTMILAAGRGERMRPLTDTMPKPLLSVRGKPLMQWPMEALAAQGFTRQLINTAWLGEQIESHFGGKNGQWSGRNLDSLLLNLEQIHFSHEGRDFGGALETAGGIVRALPLLDEVFWVAAGDVFMPGFEFSRAAYERFAQSPALAHLWFVPNPPHNPLGDFGLSAGGQALNLPKDGSSQLHTFSTVALYKKAFFMPPFCDIPAGNPQGIKAALAPLLRAGMDAGVVTAELYTGEWADIGTPERLAEINGS
jgi:N-acetyl-alpha-D-muramate 1-phosphate uridylyltransferase